MQNDSAGVPQVHAEIPQKCVRCSMSFEATFYGFIDREFAPKRNAAKLLAKAAGGISHRSAENWLRKICMPQGEQIVTLMKECPAFRDEIFELTAQIKKEP